MYHLHKRHGRWAITHPRAPEGKHTSFASYQNAVDSLHENEDADFLYRGTMEVLAGLLLLALIGISW